MRIYLLALSFTLSFFVPAKAQKKMSFYLDNYKHTINYPDGKVTLHVQSNDQTLSYTDPSKSYHWYSNNQLKITQGGFSGKLLHGIYTRYYLDNNLQEQGEFKMGLKTGHWNNWTDSGTLTNNINYRQGIAEGRFYKYDENGRVSEKGKYLHGKLNGKLIKYVGDSTQLIKYNNGNVVAPKVKKEKTTGIFYKIKQFFKKKPKTKVTNQDMIGAPINN